VHALHRLGLDDLEAGRAFLFR